MVREDFGWSLPPGVRTSDIPGCRPEDEEVSISVVVSKGEVKDLATHGTQAACFENLFTNDSNDLWWDTSIVRQVIDACELLHAKGGR